MGLKPRQKKVQWKYEAFYGEEVYELQVWPFVIVVSKYADEDEWHWLLDSLTAPDGTYVEDEIYSMSNVDNLESWGDCATSDEAKSKALKAAKKFHTRVISLVKKEHKKLG